MNALLKEGEDAAEDARKQIASLQQENESLKAQFTDLEESYNRLNELFTGVTVALVC